MTVRELKELIARVPDNYEVRYEYVGPNSTQEIFAEGLLISNAANCILLTEDEADTTIEEP